MMKLADIGPLIWVIVAVMVALSKGWSKLQQSADNDSSKSDDSPPVVPPRPQGAPPPRLQPRPAAVPMPRRGGLPPQQRAAPPTVPRRGTASISGDRKVSADDIRQFVEQLSGKPQRQQPPPPPLPPPIQPPVSRRSVRKAAPPPPPPKTEPAVAAPVATQTVAAAPTQPSRAWQWMEALRDRNNVRNIVIGAEVIGPPKAESM
ncbi:MAG TPA: hypothetical protein VLZ30_01325 [Verrucomicrobiae bacterium]|nr:hypothetical protein [Verrucomicrobiae bacterium]